MNIAKASGKTQAQEKLSYLIGTKMKPGLHQWVNLQNAGV